MVFKTIVLRIQRIFAGLRDSGSVWNYLHGFTKETVELNGINKNNYRAFMDDRRYMKGHPYNGPFSSIIDNKIYLPYLLKNYPEHVPQYYFFISKGRIKSMTPLYDNDIDGFMRLLKDQRILALKQCYSSFGNGFYVIEENDKGDVFINKEKVQADRLRTLFYSLQDYICTEYVRQHDYCMNVCSTSLNTIRFLCVRDKETDSFYVARCFHRLGVEGSLVDNLGSGNGFLFLIDIETGKLKASGAKNVKNQGEIYVDKLDYPGGKAYAGMQIPRFEQIKEKVLEISESFPFLKYIGWDVAVTPDGFKLIEANSLTSLGVLQREGGFLEDKRLCDFFTNN